MAKLVSFAMLHIIDMRCYFTLFIDILSSGHNTSSKLAWDTRLPQNTIGNHGHITFLTSWNFPLSDLHVFMAYTTWEPFFRDQVFIQSWQSTAGDHDHSWYFCSSIFTAFQKVIPFYHWLCCSRGSHNVWDLRCSASLAVIDIYCGPFVSFPPWRLCLKLSEQGGGERRVLQISNENWRNKVSVFQQPRVFITVLHFSK